MMIFASKPKNALIAEGTYPAKLNSIAGLPDNDKPKKARLGFMIEGHETELFKEVPASFDPGKPLRKDAESILGSELTATDAQAGFNMDTLIGRSCTVTVMHKAASGGKPQALVSVIQRAQ